MHEITIQGEFESWEPRFLLLFILKSENQTGSMKELNMLVSESTIRRTI
jgi:hypothetical protein